MPCKHASQTLYLRSANVLNALGDVVLTIVQEQDDDVRRRTADASN